MKDEKKYQNKLGLLGQHISYSLSPLIHNYSAIKLGINQSYQLFDLDQSQLNSFLNKFWHQGGQGLNITTPHKQTVAKLLNLDQEISINTLYRGKDYWLAQSTDGQGFASALQRLGQPVGNFKHIIFLGSGGVVGAVLNYLRCEQHNVEVSILRRSLHNDIFLARQYHLPLKFYDFKSAILKQLITSQNSRHTLLVQATSAPHHDNSLSDFIDSLADFDGTFFDMVYGKLSALFYYCQNKGLVTLDGLPMLIEQARFSQKLWWGHSISYEELWSQINHYKLKV